MLQGINEEYHQTSDINHTLVDNKIVDHSDVVGASPVGATPTTSSFSFLDITPGFNGWGRDNCKMGQETFKCWDLLHLILEVGYCWQCRQLKSFLMKNKDLFIGYSQYHMECWWSGSLQCQGIGCHSIGLVLTEYFNQRNKRVNVSLYHSQFCPNPSK